MSLAVVASLYPSTRSTALEPDRKFPLTDMLTGLMAALVTRTIARRPACYEA
jgi:hypothetical protein